VSHPGDDAVCRMRGMRTGSSRHRFARAVAAAAGAVLLLGSTGCAPDGPTSRTSASRTVGTVTVPLEQRGEPLDATGTTLEGADFRLSAYRGKVVVVNVWGAFCTPCRAESRELEAAWQALRADDVQFVGVNLDPSVPTARSFQTRFGMTYPSVQGADGRTLLGFRGALPLKTVPATLVLDPLGRPAVRILGQTTGRAVRAAVAQVRAES
jgi:peroxiredoxin